MLSASSTATLATTASTTATDASTIASATKAESASTNATKARSASTIAAINAGSDHRDYGRKREYDRQLDAPGFASLWSSVRPEARRSAR